jgi:hypothetical protein
MTKTNDSILQKKKSKSRHDEMSDVFRWFTVLKALFVGFMREKYRCMAADSVDKSKQTGCQSLKKIKPRHDESDDNAAPLYTNRVPGETEKSRQ